jgi:hypothetical protein
MKFSFLTTPKLSGLTLYFLRNPQKHKKERKKHAGGAPKKELAPNVIMFRFAVIYDFFGNGTFPK